MEVKKLSETVEIKRYLHILDGAQAAEVNPIVNEDNTLYFGNIKIGSRFLYEDGLRWIKVVSEKADKWIINYGFAGSKAEAQIAIQKSELSSLLCEDKIEYDDEKQESLFEGIVETNTKYDEFMEKIDRYLLKNYQVESSNVEADWESLFEDGYSPSDAAEYAFLRG